MVNKKNPGNEEGGVDMHKGIWQLSAQHSSKDVGLREAKNDDAQNEQPHCREKNVVSAQLVRQRHRGSHHLYPRSDQCVAGSLSSQDRERALLSEIMLFLWGRSRICFYPEPYQFTARCG